MAKDAWHGEWRTRIYTLLREKGFDSTTSYADTMPLVPVLELAEQIGSNVAAIQLEMLLFQEAQEHNSLPRFLRSLLVRRIREAAPEGWRKGDPKRFQFRLASTIASWQRVAGKVISEQEQEQIWKAIRDADVQNGWLPDGPDDPVIVAALRGTRLATKP